MSRAIEERIGEVVARQHGVVTNRQLRAAGLSAAAIGRRLRSGRLRELHRGVYLTLPCALPHTAEMAAVLASGAGAALSCLSAAERWGLRAASGVGARQAPVDVNVQNRSRRRAGIRVHAVARPAPDEVTTLDGIPITSVQRTLLDLASALDDHELELAVARAERNGLVRREALLAYVARKRGRRGAAALRRFLALPGGPALTRSEAEARFLALVRKARLQTPKANVRVGPYEVDFLWRTESIAVEVDGYRYHASHERFEGDRRRDAELLARGITVLRLTWRQIVNEPLATVALLTQALAARRR